MSDSANPLSTRSSKFIAGRGRRASHDSGRVEFGAVAVIDARTKDNNDNNKKKHMPRIEKNYKQT